MNPVRPKKHLGQHFLTDRNIARKIVDSLSEDAPGRILEIGPGTGILSQLLLDLPERDVKFAEIDTESVSFLEEQFPAIRGNILHGDVLRMPLDTIWSQPFALIGNFPYNISSQLFFMVLDHRNLVPEVVCMIQKEVARRIASPPGSREYGILSVLLQTYYNIAYLFTVPPQVFSPPPKVQSAVIRLVRNDRAALPCDEALFVKVVKTAFNQRRKVMRNSLRPLLRPGVEDHPLLTMRPEQLGVEDFILLTEHVVG